MRRQLTGARQRVQLAQVVVLAALDVRAQLDAEQAAHVLLPHQLRAGRWQAALREAIRQRIEEVAMMGREKAVPLRDGVGFRGLRRAPLDRRAGLMCARDLVEQRLGRASGDDCVGDLISVALVGITLFAHATLQVNAAALLHHVRGLVRRRMEARRPSERDIVAGRERLRAHGRGRFARLCTGMSLHPTHVMATEGLLDRLEMGKRTAATACASLGRRVD